MFEKQKKEEKFHEQTWAASNLQPSDLCSNAYRSPLGSQVFSCICTCIHGILESDLLSQSIPNGTIWIFFYHDGFLIPEVGIKMCVISFA